MTPILQSVLNTLYYIPVTLQLRGLQLLPSFLSRRFVARSRVKQRCTLSECRYISSLYLVSISRLYISKCRSFTGDTVTLGETTHVGQTNTTHHSALRLRCHRTNVKWMRTIFGNDAGQIISSFGQFPRMVCTHVRRCASVPPS